MLLPSFRFSFYFFLFGFFFSIYRNIDVFFRSTRVDSGQCTGCTTLHSLVVLGAGHEQFKMLPFYILALHRILKSNSNKRFCNWDFTCAGHIFWIIVCTLAAIEVRTTVHLRPSRDSNPQPLGEHLLGLKCSSLYDIDFREIFLNKT